MARIEGLEATPSTPVVTPIARRVGRFLWRGLSTHRVFFALLGVHAAVGTVVTWRLGIDMDKLDIISQLRVLFVRLLPVFSVVLAFAMLVRLILRERPARPLLAASRRLQAHFREPAASVGLVAGLVFLGLFMSTFSMFKAQIPEILPFPFDPAIARLEQALLGGYHAYELLMPVIRSAPVMAVLNLAYHVWFLVMFFAVFTALVFGARARARRYLVAFALTWIVGGNVMAVLMSSAGPVYFARLGHGDAFVPLTDALRQTADQTPLFALNVHELLWNSYVTGEGFPGISAMPSMHVAIAVLLAIAASGLGRLAALLAWSYAAMIWIGSVVFAWHYALDGGVGALVSWAAWAWAVRLLGTGQDQPSTEKDRSRAT